MALLWTVVDNLSVVKIEEAQPTQQESKAGLTVFVNSQLNEQKLKGLVSDLESNKLFKKIEKIDSKDSKDLLVTQFGPDFKDLIQEESMPTVLLGYFKNTNIRRADYQSLLSRLKNDPLILGIDGVIDLNSQSNFLSLSFINWIFSLLIIIFVVATVLIFFVFRSLVENLKTEAGIFHYLGQASWRLFLPLVSIAVALALLSSGAALFMLEYGMQNLLARHLGQFFSSGGALYPLSLQSNLILAAVVLGAALIGVFSCWPAMNRKYEKLF